MREAKISEIFLSIQGEGIYFGIPQLFIRFYRCNLSCGFCDTDLDSYQIFTLDNLMGKIAEYKAPYHSLSLTGGEPLLQAYFIRDFLRAHKESHKKPVYLETNGILYRELSRVVDYVDIIAMDFKLPSSTGETDFWRKHEKFLRIANRKKVFIKAVITSATTSEDISRMRKVAYKIAKDIPIVLQPVTALSESERIPQEFLSRFRDILKESMERVEIIPQVHRMIGVR
ncbi:MAG: hypothetical protein A2Z72_00780 [Omnitrophica bacterium RBG_13_46_9]|nr:MAG: hypothetical protein A2Z72_00780 [Omnitrophica bacterium RBG_13_46_9]